jgi:hypothetical protein
MKKKKDKKKQAPQEKGKKKLFLKAEASEGVKDGKKEGEEEETSDEIEPEAADIIEKAETEGDDDAPEKEYSAGAVKSGYKNSLLLYFDQIRAEKVLTEKEEKDIIRKAQKGDKKSREGLIRANLKLAEHIRRGRDRRRRGRCGRACHRHDGRRFRLLVARLDGLHTSHERAAVVAVGAVAVPVEFHQAAGGGHGDDGGAVAHRSVDVVLRGDGDVKRHAYHLRRCPVGGD